MGVQFVKRSYNPVSVVCFRFTLIVSLTFGLGSCSLIGKREHSSAKNDKEYSFRQNLTARYNILYNAELMLEEEQRSIAQTARENYEVRLTVFDEPIANGDPHALMDSLIQKSYKIINNKQESKYVNEAYYILGKANYLKGDYYTATEFFNNLLLPIDGQRKYIPLAYAWRSRAELRLGKLEQAQLSVDSAFMFLDEQKTTRTLVNACKANYLLSTGKTLEAIPYLEYALEAAPNQKTKYRWLFLLSQLYQENNENELAYKGFRKIAKRNVPFEMAFEASLKAAELKGEEGSTLKERVDPLKKMLKEGKNEEFKDRILYKIGRLYMGEGKHGEALTYFDQSLQQEKGSLYQTTTTYLTIADYYFDHQDYVKAQSYYDSVAMTLPSDYTDVDHVRRKLGYMSELTKLYEDNLWQDTLIRLATLPENLRQEQIDKFVEGALSVEKKKWENKYLELNKRGNKKVGNRGKIERNPLLRGTEVTQPEQIQPDSRFYFNNMDALTLGTSEFKRRWGNRQLKENWRYTPDQSRDLSGKPEATEREEKESVPQEFDEARFVELESDRLLKNVPLHKEQYDSVYSIIHNNLIIIGNIYRDYIQDIPEAIKINEEFLERFPESTDRPEVLYSLSRMYEDIDVTKSSFYKMQLIESYPKSIHALVAQDPNYLDKVKREKAVLDRAFERLYDLYASGMHDRVIEEADKALQGSFANSAMVAQIRYLKALAVGRVGRLHDFTYELENIVIEFPQDSLVTPLAQSNLSFVKDNPDLFLNRVNALQDRDLERIAFVDEPDMTPWPSLVIQGDYRSGIALVSDKKEERDGPQLGEGEEIASVDVADEEEEEAEEIERLALQNVDPLKQRDDLKRNNEISIQTELDKKAIDIGNLKIDFGPNEYRDKSLFPDISTYYYVINVMDSKLNLAPSRYGIGQFLRTRYSREKLSHQVKDVNGENQLIFVGPFDSFEEVKSFEGRILPLIPDIMKMPEEVYNSFVITGQLMESLTDGIKVNNYHQIYIEQ